jgi:class 3 adenylate cyclase
MTESGEKIVALPLLKGSSIEDTLSGFGPQMDQNAHLGHRVVTAVSVLAVEIRGWEAVAARVCAARTETLLEQTAERVADALEALGARDITISGTVQQPALTCSFDGDDEHAFRAVVAAQAARDVAGARLHPSFEERFHACAGVSTGTVVETRVNGSGLEFQSSGTVKLFAARLQEFAGPDQIFMCEETYRSMAGHVDVVALGGVRTNGDGETREAYCLRGLMTEQTP